MAGLRHSNVEEASSLFVPSPQPKNAAGSTRTRLEAASTSRPGQLRLRRVLRPCFFLALCSATAAFGASLGLGEPVQDGGRAVVPVVIETGGDEKVAGLQFELEFGRAGLQVLGVEAGDSARDAFKEANFSARSGSVLVIVAGLNLDCMRSGDVAVVYIESPASQDAPATITLGSAVLSDPMGRRVPADVMGHVIIRPEATETAPAKSAGTGGGAAGQDGMQETAATPVRRNGHSAQRLTPDRSPGNGAEDGAVKGGQGGLVSPRTHAGGPRPSSSARSVRASSSPRGGQRDALRIAKGNPQAAARPSTSPEGQAPISGRARTMHEAPLVRGSEEEAQAEAVLAGMTGNREASAARSGKDLDARSGWAAAFVICLASLACLGAVVRRRLSGA